MSAFSWTHCLAKTSPQLKLLLMTCYTTCLYVVHSNRALKARHRPPFSFLFWNLAFRRRILEGKYLTRNQGEHLIAATGTLMKVALQLRESLCNEVVW